MENNADVNRMVSLWAVKMIQWKTGRLFLVGRQEVSTIPVDIDVDQVYLLRCILSAPGNELSKILNDGRSYQGKTTTCKANKDIFKFGKSVNVYNNKCKGSMVCVNDNLKII